MRKLVIGIAWYRPEQWPQLLTLAADAAKLERTHDEWLRSASKTIADLEAKGTSIQKVEVDVQQMADWCARQGKPFDGSARAEYVAEQLRSRRPLPGADR